MSKDLSYKKNLIWNMIASVVNAAEAVIVIMVTSRINEREESGILTLAFSLANLFMMVGKFGIKNYQISHDGYDVEFKRFLRLRALTVFLMLVTMLGYLSVNLITGRYSPHKSIIILCVCIWYLVEAFEDVFVAHLQSMGQLHIGNKMFIFRWTLILGTIVVTDMVSKNLILSLILSDFAATIAEIIGILLVTNKYTIKMGIRSAEIKSLFIGNLPLCISDLSYFFLTNVSKYVIDSKMDDVTQAIYGYIAMPVFVISLLNSIIYQPKLMSFVADIRERNISGLIKKIAKQAAIIVAILIICLLGAFLLGIPVLSWLYSMDLREYKAFLLILIAGGAALALGGFFETILVLIGRRKSVMIGYISVAVFSLLVTVLLVDKLRFGGAVYGYLISMIAMAAVFLGQLIHSLGKLKKDVG